MTPTPSPSDNQGGASAGATERHQCPQCGHQNPARYAFCSTCGARIKSHFNPAAIVGILFLVLAVGGVAYNRSQVPATPPPPQPAAPPPPVTVVSKPAPPPSDTSPIKVKMRPMSIAAYSGQRLTSGLYLDGQPVKIPKAARPHFRVVTWRLHVWNPTQQKATNVSYRLIYLDDVGHEIAPTDRLPGLAVNGTERSVGFEFVSQQHLPTEMAPKQEQWLVLKELVGKNAASRIKGGRAVISARLAPVAESSQAETPQLAQSSESNGGAYGAASASAFEIITREGTEYWAVIQVRLTRNVSLAETESWARRTAQIEFPDGRGTINFYAGAMNSDGLIAQYSRGHLQQLGE